MKWSLLIVIGCSLYAASYGADCKPGTEWSTECDTKTKDLNLGYDGSSFKPTETQQELNQKECTPGERTKIDCNYCTCTENGIYACTEMYCYKEADLAQEGKSALNKTLVCEPNTAFRKDCNTCWCSDDGSSYFCTRKVCVPSLDDSVDQPEEMRVIEKACRPREVFELDCNTCRCNDDGKSFSCTGRACVTDAPPDAVDYKAKDAEPLLSGSRIRRQSDFVKQPAKACEPGSQFRVDCNTCLCHTDGQSFACTRYDCSATTEPQPAPSQPPPSRRRRRREVGQKEARDCTPGGVFEQGCNVCRCEGDGQHASCTLKKCPTPQKQDTGPESDFRCSPGEKFKRSCNDCTCSADGKSVFCTIKLCEKEIVSQV